MQLDRTNYLRCCFSRIAMLIIQAELHVQLEVTTGCDQELIPGPIALNRPDNSSTNLLYKNLNIKIERASGI